MQEKNVTILISWMEQISIWHHGMDPTVQFLPKWLSDIACNHAHTRMTPFCLFWWCGLHIYLFIYLFTYFKFLKLLKGLRHIFNSKPASIPPGLSGKLTESILTGGKAWPALGVTSNTVRSLLCLEPWGVSTVQISNLINSFINYHKRHIRHKYPKGRIRLN